MCNAFSVIDEGQGPAVLCLHGFPQNASAFDALAAELVAGGCRVIRYTQRGYTDDEFVGARCSYTVSELARDAVEVLDRCRVSSAVVVGHDLGGLVAWELARVAESRISSVVVAGVSHPGAFLLSLLGVRQIAKSWYFLVAQSTVLAKLMYSPRSPRSRHRFQIRLARTGLPFSESEPYIDYLAHGHRFEGAIRWYQAMPFASLRSAFFRIRTPAHIILGDHDALTGSLAISLSRLFASPRTLKVTRMTGGTHWLLDSSSAALAQLLMAELQL